MTEIHQPRQPQSRRAVGGNRVRLPVFLHLQAMLDVAQEPVGASSCRASSPGNRWYCASLARQASVCAICRNGCRPACKICSDWTTKFDFADAAAPQLDVAFQFVRAHDFLFDPAL